jgi:hypothetical protein
MCELCYGSVKFEHAGTARPGEEARNLLSLDANLAGPPTAQRNGQGEGEKTSTTVGKKSQSDEPAETAEKTPLESDSRAAEAKKAFLMDKYGIQVRQVNGENELFYRAGRKDNVVLRTSTDQAALDNAPQQLDKIVQQKIASIEDKFNVTFAKPGEFATMQEIEDENCNPAVGEKVSARQGTLPVLHGIEEGLNQSQPSQFIEGGREGVKIYLLDKQHLPDFYGGRKVQGTFRFKGPEGKPVVFLTPAGQEQPPTARDTAKPGDRNVAWITTHEVAHNSQSLQWKNQTPESVAEALGWQKFAHPSGVTIYPFIKGKGGELYANFAESCKVPSKWFSLSTSFKPLDAQGRPVTKTVDAAPFTNEQVMDRAKVRPSTFYFSSPYEEMAESITSFRFSAESRSQLFKNSPRLYMLTQEYDRNELKNFYGSDGGNARMVRTPDGKVVPRTPQSMKMIDDFERQLVAGSRER